LIYLLCSISLNRFCFADEPGNKEQQVTISGQQTDIAASQNFIAGKIIIGRKRIEESGLQTAGELLREEPAISVTSNGRIGLLGLPGYTQILIDGKAQNLGSNITDFPLLQIEKIEITKSTLAEFGPYSIAGTINIITRSSARKTSTNLDIDASTYAGRASSSANWSHNWSQDGSPWRWQASISASHSQKDGATEQIQRQQAPQHLPVLQWQSQTNNLQRQTNVFANTELSWQADAKNRYTLKPNWVSLSSHNDTTENKRWFPEKITLLHTLTASDMTGLENTLSWIHKLEQGELKLSWRTSRQEFNQDNLRNESGAVSTPAIRKIKENSDLKLNSLDVDFKKTLSDEHTLKAGSKLIRSSSKTRFQYLLNEQTDTSMAGYSQEQLDHQNNISAFMQDEWTINNAYAINFGISAEDKKISVTDGNFVSEPHFRLWSPSLHMAYKLGSDDKRQVRLSLARSYQAPNLTDINIRPQINPLAPCPGNGLCTANSASTADTAGNPGLQPERSLGLNLSYSHGLTDNSQFSIEFFMRNFEQKLGYNIGLENVNWAIDPRYVIRPANLGNARSRGIDLEMQFAAKDIWAQAPSIQVRGGLSFAQSYIDSVPGPDNRFPDQSPWRAKLGVSYSASDRPMKLDLNARWLPGSWVRSNLTQRQFKQNLFSLDSSLSWKFSPSMRLVCKLNNIFPQAIEKIDEFRQADGLTELYTNTTRYRSLGIRLEMKL
jgi:outer membrane cobalamin receptor